MKFLVFGTGVLGCNLANNLFRAGKDVTCFRFFKLMCATSLEKLCASDHAMNAVEEMSALNWDMKAFFDAISAEYPVWQALETECGRYLL